MPATSTPAATWTREPLAPVFLRYAYEKVDDGEYWATVRIENRGDEPIRGWTLEYRFEPEITGVWQARMSYTPSTHQVRAWHADRNRVIGPGETVEFGFRYEGGPAEPVGCVFNGRRCAWR